jgi:3-deoxy-7-phosphoheptulonate synthase
VGHVAYVPDMARAAAASGADGIIIETHPDPAQAMSDGPQSLNFPDFAALMDSLRPIADAVGRPMRMAGQRGAGQKTNK